MGGGNEIILMTALYALPSLILNVMSCENTGCCMVVVCLVHHLGNLRNYLHFLKVNYLDDDSQVVFKKN